MANQSDLKNYQRSLDENAEEKRHFIESEVSNTTDDESSENEDSEEAIKIVAPRRSQKKSNVDMMLMEQLITHQKAYLKAQRRIYKLRNEIDTEEVKTRYVKLDLNNAEVRISELTVANRAVQNRFYKLLAANATVLFLLLAILFARVM